MIDAKPKPCPFCGGVPKKLSTFGGAHWVECSEECPMQPISDEFGTMQEALDAWNRRDEQQLDAALGVARSLAEGMAAAREFVRLCGESQDSGVAERAELWLGAFAEVSALMISMGWADDE